MLSSIALPEHYHMEIHTILILIFSFIFPLYKSYSIIDFILSVEFISGK